jgi:hypothetical protein
VVSHSNLTLRATIERLMHASSQMGRHRSWRFNLTERAFGQICAAGPIERALTEWARRVGQEALNQLRFTLQRLWPRY